MFNWDYEYTIYIPDAVPSWLRDNFEWNMEQHFGGFTRYEAHGGWYDNQARKSIREEVYVYKLISEDPKDHVMKKMVDSILVNTGEKEVLWTKAPIEIGKD